MSTHNLCFLWRTGENYPRIISKYSTLTIPLIKAITVPAGYLHTEKEDMDMRNLYFIANIINKYNLPDHFQLNVFINFPSKQNPGKKNIKIWNC